MYTDGLLDVMEAIAVRLPAEGGQVPRSAVLSVFALMVGTVQLSRALTDRALADELLGRAVADALGRLGGGGGS
ncbi:hypothetical protein ABZ454_38530 [Streptomyces sp. NPDC005803]|uniref:hypothetical protein n=1 Tax=Streptomyces sp. NPDC005803 TaxID=3154297 RepID=UPI0033E2F478